MSRYPGIIIIAVFMLMQNGAFVHSQGPLSPCRMAPGSAHQWCGLPWELANFQGKLECADEVRVGRPRDEDEVAELVGKFKHVKAVGVGHSWWKDQFCSGSDATAINIVMTELDALRPIYALQGGVIGGPAVRARALESAIQVNEVQGIVTVKAGVPQRVLLDHLAAYRNGLNPEGWVIQGYSWFIDQTIGGAVATGTHGSSLRYGSLSDQVLGVEVVLGNGTIAHYTQWSHPHYFRALKVSVGRLGVITKLVMRIHPQVPVRRRRTAQGIWAWIDQLKGIQEAYKSLPARSSRELLDSVEETQTFWFIPQNDVWRMDYEKLDEQAEIRPEDEISIEAFDAEAYEQNENPSLMANLPITINPRGWSAFFRQGIQGNTIPGVFSSRSAYLAISEVQNVGQNSQYTYDQYEVAIPLEVAGDCVDQVAREMYGMRRLWTGFRTPALMRLVAEEDAYLSNTNGGARLYINLEDYISPAAGRNPNFHAVLDLFRHKCGARLHWGKAGWMEGYGQCFDGTIEYPSSWCHFGCAVADLDPYGKFNGESDVWQWRASRNGRSVPFSSCCSSETGFDYSRCTCDMRPINSCPHGLSTAYRYGTSR